MQINIQMLLLGFAAMFLVLWVVGFWVVSSRNLERTLGGGGECVSHETDSERESVCDATETTMAGLSPSPASGGSSPEKTIRSFMFLSAEAERPMTYALF